MAPIFRSPAREGNDGLGTLIPRQGSCCGAWPVLGGRLHPRLEPRPVQSGVVLPADLTPPAPLSLAGEGGAGGEAARGHTFAFVVLLLVVCETRVSSYADAVAMRAR